eukprot:12421489-Karenia_brevis.AAC.1
MATWVAELARSRACNWLDLGQVPKRKGSRATKRRLPPLEAEQGGHSWKWTGEKWRCRVCNTSASVKAWATNRQRERCPGALEARLTAAYMLEGVAEGFGAGHR